MEIASYIVAYIISIFLNRFLNWWAVKSDSSVDILPGIWFLPIIPTVIFIFLILYIKFDDGEEKSTWFTGGRWKR